MCFNSTTTGGKVGDLAVDAVGGAADYASGGALTPELVGLVGSQLTQNAQQTALNKQSDIAAANIIQQGNLNKEAENDVGSTVAKIAKSNPKASAATVQNAEDKALQLGEQTASAAQPGVPGAGKAFKGAQAGATNTAQDYIGGIKSGIVGTMAPTLQRIGESQQIAGSASDLGLLSQQSNRDNYLSQIREQSVTQNPFESAAGTGLGIAGTAMGAYQGYEGGNVPWESASSAGSTNPFIQFLNGAGGKGRPNPSLYAAPNQGALNAAANPSVYSP